MATIVSRRLKDGSLSFRTTVRIMRGNTILHRETRSFRSKPVAQQWARTRESELKKDGVGEKAIAALRAKQEVQVETLIDQYIEEFHPLRQWGSAKTYNLSLLKRHVGRWDASTITPDTILDYARQRRIDGVSAATVFGQLKLLRVVFKVARAAWGRPVQLQNVDDAILAARHLGMVGVGNKRDRRPNADELDRLRDWFGRKDHRRKVPMNDVVDFAIASSRRLSEIFRLRWEDIDRTDMTIVVRDMKHPNGSQGNHMTVKLTRHALEIIDRQPCKDEGPIFPYKASTAKECFARACDLLKIDNLHFHDLRHEAVSRLFEAGYQIHEVAQFSGHKEWGTLKIYTNLRPANLKLRQ